MGSVKDLEWLSPAFANWVGQADFRFSDRYSVKDWGEMPDHILGKGAALAVMAACNFEQLNEMGIQSHYKGLIVDGKLVNVSDLADGSNGSNIMRVKMAVKYDPTPITVLDDNHTTKVTYDYSFYEANRGKLDNFLIPLEIIFRNGLPRGSSVFKRLKEAAGNQAKVTAILDRFGLKEIPKEGDMLPSPVVEYTTKLEPGDRSLTADEAYAISGLKYSQFSQIPGVALIVNDLVTRRAEKAGLSPHWDGKVEMGFFGGRLGLVDVLGTPDEDRFGSDFSKELLRQWYDKNDPEWVAAIDQYKPSGKGWQERCPIKPKHLPDELPELVGQMYRAICNAYVGKEIFPVPSLEVVIDRLKPYRA